MGSKELVNGIPRVCVVMYQVVWTRRSVKGHKSENKIDIFINISSKTIGIEYKAKRTALQQFSYNNKYKLYFASE